MPTDQKIYRLIMRRADGAAEEVEPYSKAEVAKYLLPELNLETELERWRSGYTEAHGEGADRVEYIHFVGDIPEGVSVARPNTEDTNTYRLTLADGTFFEKEYPATDDSEGDALNACWAMILRLPKSTCATEQGVNFCQLIDGCENAYDLHDVLAATLVSLGYYPNKLPPEPENTRTNILDGDLPTASADLSDLKLAQLCDQAVEIMNTGTPDGSEGEQVAKYLRDLNAEVIKRMAFGVFISLCAAALAAIGGGMLTLHAWGEFVSKTMLNGLQFFYAASVIVFVLGLSNKQMVALQNWAGLLGVSAAKQRREELERRAREKSEGDDGQQR